MTSPTPVDQYRKQQEEADRQKMLEKTEDFIFINQMLRVLDVRKKR